MPAASIESSGVLANAAGSEGQTNRVPVLSVTDDPDVTAVDPVSLTTDLVRIRAIIARSRIEKDSPRQSCLLLVV